MSKHTPEPWGMRGPKTSDCGLERAPDYIITPPDFNARLETGGMTELVAFVDDESNLHRIVACVNALAGIDDPAAFVRAARELADDVDWMLNTDAALAAFRAADKQDSQQRPPQP